MSNFLERLLVPCDQREEVIVTADEALDWDPGELDWCLSTGILVSTSPAVELVCHECAEQSVERIVYLGPEGGDCLQAYLPCPQCGPVRVPPERLNRWRMDVPRLWKAVFADASINLDCAKSFHFEFGASASHVGQVRTGISPSAACSGGLTVRRLCTEHGWRHVRLYSFRTGRHYTKKLTSSSRSSCCEIC